MKYLKIRDLAVVAGFMLTLTGGMALDGCSGQPPQPQKPVSSLGTGPQRPHYSGPQRCLTEGQGQPPQCRKELPECLNEDGSGPGVWCWFTSEDGRIWFNDGDEGNDQP